MGEKGGVIKRKGTRGKRERSECCPPQVSELATQANARVKVSLWRTVTLYLHITQPVATLVKEGVIL